MGATAAPTRRDIFTGLSREQTLALSGSQSHISLHAGEAVFEEGSHAFGLYVLLEGRLEVVRKSGGVGVRLAELGPRDVFGEIGLLGEVRAVSRTAERVREAAALGFGRVALPARTADAKLPLPTVPIASVSDLVALLQ